MGSINKQISRYETTAVYTHPDAKVDIILVHGLNGDPQKTWTAKNGVFWPADLLPISLREARANVLVYGYNADVYSKKHGSNPSDNFIYMHAQTLVTSLTHYRKDELTSSNPIIWVCHSLGGILVKRALLYSNDLRASQHEDYRSIYVSTYGMVFLGTPHTGSDIATWGTILQAMSDAVVPRSFFQSESVLLRTLKRDNETLQNINNHFLDVYQRFKILMAHENHKTDLKGTKMLVVDASSAGPQLPGVTYYAIEATHSNMCKFDSKNAPGYRTIATAIREWVLDAPDVIKTRWRVEDDERLARAKHEIEERMKPWIQSQRLQADQGANTSQQNNETSLSPSHEHSKVQFQSRPLLTEPETPVLAEDEEEIYPSQQSRDDQNSVQEPMFVKPSVFRPNTYFKGREKELKLLHRMLTDRKRRSVGTSSVLIQSMPGGGKSHLARQYVFQHKYDYPGGVFWIRAKSLQELEYGYYDIAKVAGLSEITINDQDQVSNAHTVIKAVQAWLSSTDKWLLVFDGIHFDFEGLEHFIPFTKNTSIIYTSTERTTGEEYQFDNPQVIALDPLAKREAQELLFEEMGKKQPYTQDDLQRAEELVELMDRLPLMIHVAALQLKATREPLAKYLRSYKSRPKVGKLLAYRAVCEQLEHRGAIAALNLMSLLAFFGNHIPVEMVALGAKALDKRTPVKSKGPESRKGTLNITFRILIAFALIERNESKEASSESTRSSRSVDMAQDNLDILRVHGIVQAFFVDFLNEKQEVDFWLERAICVFCSAFDASIHRVDNDPLTGTPEDYRRLLIHGRRLLSHLDRFERRFPGLKTSREELELRVDSIQHRIDQLTKRVSEAASQGSADVIISVFERTNSLSESETSPSNHSLFEYSVDDGTDTLESPSVYSPTEQGPYHWHVPVDYPPGLTEWETSRTVTPQPAATEIFNSMSMPDDDETTRKVFGPEHRTIRKHVGRRYRDHAGAWRASSQILSDPRVTISRETARGFIDYASTQRQNQRFSYSDPSLQSEAEFSLNQINQGSPREPNSLMALINLESPPSRPRLVAGRPSYAHARAEEVNAEEFPVTPTFSYPPPTAKDAAATIMKLKESDRPVSLDGLTPIKVSGPLAEAPMDPEEIPPAFESQSTQIGPEDNLVASLQSSMLSPEPPSRLSSGPSSRPSSVPLSRSTRSSPSHPTGPFAPPPISIELNTTSSLRSGPLSNPNHASSHHLSTHSLEEYSDDAPHRRSTPYSNLPYPHTVPIRPEPFSMPEPPAPWVPSSLPSNLHPQGYSSQPMSRDPSHQSNSSLDSRRSLPQALNTSPSSSNPALSSSPASQIMQQPRARRPSVVQTEPSPRLNPIELESVVTSYQLYKDSRDSTSPTSRHIFRGRRRGGSTPGSTGHHTSGSGPRLLSRIRSLRSRSDSRRRDRRSSSGDGLNNNITSENDRYGAVLERQAKAGEEMTRSGSGSGGIRLDKDTVVAFGSPPAQAAATVAEARRRSPRIGSSSPLASQPFAPPRENSASPPSARGSPPRGIGLGIQ
ncbi:lipa and NB-ARC domain-containing protein [Xylaria flabelliformis]|nr:lipa and NB-ARC domain-containing protein [Xylaria flabelliformis]